MGEGGGHFAKSIRKRINSSELLVEGSGEVGFRIVGTLGPRSLRRARKNISHIRTDFMAFDSEIKSFAMSTF